MEFLNKYITGAFLPCILIILGLYFGFKLKWFYIFHPLKTIKTMLKHQKQGFKSLTVALAGTLGVGNIIGVGSAILSGGAGSIFWMWISALCSMSLKYVEVFLAIRHRQTKNGRLVGGAPYYIKDGLKKKFGKYASFLSYIFAILCVINSLSTGNLVQINAVSSLSPLSELSFGIIFTIMVFIVLIGGYKRISKMTSILIPVLSFSYIILALYIILSNFSQITSVFALILKDAFSFKSAISGFFGYGISAGIRYGVCRGTLSNEAGCGTSPCAHASSDSNSPHGQGCLGIFEVFVDTILLCTLTALVILLSNVNYAENATQLVLYAFEQFTGSFGYYTIIILSILFAFATVVCQFFYGSESLSYVSNSKASKCLYLIVFCVILLIGSVIPMSIMWEISDLVIATMTIFNSICLFLLRKEIKALQN